MALARKLSAPTGRPVVAIMPTGGSTVDARPRAPEALPYDPPAAKSRKSTVGGKKRVRGNALAGDGPTLAAIYERERRRAGLPASGHVVGSPPARRRTAGTGGGA